MHFYVHVLVFLGRTATDIFHGILSRGVLYCQCIFIEIVYLPCNHVRVPATTVVDCFMGVMHHLSHALFRIDIDDYAYSYMFLFFKRIKI